MDLFTIAIASATEAEKLYTTLQLHMDCKSGLTLQSESINKDVQTKITCHIDEQKCNQELLTTQLSIASDVISEFLIVQKEHLWIERLVKREFDYYDKEEIRKIRDYCVQLLAEDDFNGSGERQRTARMEKMADVIQLYLQNERFMNMDGFVQFRLQSYLDDLREVVAYAVDEFIMDRQYQEFIALLQYFVNAQQAKTPLVHLLHKGDYDFNLLDQALQPVQTRQLESLVLEMVEQDLNYEDLIVSSLITLAPAKIKIHTTESEMQVIKTIQQIFTGRTELCDHCSVCQSKPKHSLQSQP